MGENYGRFNPYPVEFFNKGKFLVPPDIEQKVKKLPQGNAFLQVDYYPDINKITPDSVVAAAAALLDT